MEGVRRFFRERAAYAWKVLAEGYSAAQDLYNKVELLLGFGLIAVVLYFSARFGGLFPALTAALAIVLLLVIEGGHRQLSKSEARVRQAQNETMRVEGRLSAEKETLEAVVQRHRVRLAYINELRSLIRLSARDALQRLQRGIRGAPREQLSDAELRQIVRGYAEYVAQVLRREGFDALADEIVALVHPTVLDGVPKEELEAKLDDVRARLQQEIDSGFFENPIV